MNLLFLKNKIEGIFRKVFCLCPHCGEHMVKIEMLSPDKWEIAIFCPEEHYLEIRSGKDPKVVLRIASSPSGIDERSLNHLSLIRGTNDG